VAAHWRAGRAEPLGLLPLDREPGGQDVLTGLAGHAAAATHPGPEPGGVDEFLNAPGQRAARLRDVLVVAQLTARTKHPERLGERGRRIRHRAEHEREHHGIRLAIAQRERLGTHLRNLHRDGRRPSRLARDAAQVRLRLDGDDPIHRWRVVPEHRAAARADLDDRAREARDEPGALLTQLLRLQTGHRKRPYPREARMLRIHCRLLTTHEPSVVPSGLVSSATDRRAAAAS
jgi:hypothetical protein